VLHGTVTVIRIIAPLAIACIVVGHRAPRPFRFMRHRNAGQILAYCAWRGWRSEVTHVNFGPAVTP
jgi:hypothetical protein